MKTKEEVKIICNKLEKALVGHSLIDSSQALCKLLLLLMVKMDYPKDEMLESIGKEYDTFRKAFDKE
jgi:cystathionine beta-lyase family protein involved in aluminum resistance